MERQPLQEDGGQACGRMGAQLASKSVQLADSNGTRLLWNATTLSAVVLELGYAVAPGGISGCCAPGLWCVNGTGGNVVCSTQSFNQLYYNPGWLPLDVQHAYQPVYVCNLPATNASELPPAAIIGAVTPVTTNSTNVAFYIDGTGFGNNSAVITAQIGDTPCSSITPCHATCQQCTPQALCGAGFTCYYFDSLLEPFGYCLQSCGAGLSCGCGGSCVSFGLAGSSSTIDLCVSPNFNDTNQQPCDSFNWGPPAATGLTDRLQCGLPSSHTQCVGVGPQTVAVTVAAVPASPITPFTPNVTLNVSTCVTPSDCGNSSLCFNWACSAGCCVTVPTGRCNSESPLNTGFTGVVLDGNYAPLPPSVATGLDLPVLSTSVDITANVSFYDSGPLDVLQLSFPINMYGYDLYALMLSPNGYVQAKHGFQCPDSATTGVFSSTGCNLQNSYSGVFGPLIANFDPSLTNPAVVLVRYGDGFLCVNWDYMPLYQPNHVYPAGAPVYTTRMCMYTPGAVQWEYFNFTTPPQNYSWMVRAVVTLLHPSSSLQLCVYAGGREVTRRPFRVRSGGCRIRN